MALPIIGPLISAVSTLGSQWMKNRGEKAEAKHQRELKVITGEIDLDHESTKGMAGSLKDEWLTAVFTTPLVVIFYGAIAGDPEVITRMVEGVQVLTTLPEWYQWCIIGIVAASFGIRTFNHFGKK
jgi:hypothetical protein